MTRETAYQEILDRTGVPDREVLAAYMYGSRVYGTARKNSDWDFVVVTSNPFKDQYSDNLINVNFYTYKQHFERLAQHEPSAMECFFLPDEFILKADGLFHNMMRDGLKISKEQLRASFSAKASNSWVKAKKKLTVEKDYNDAVGKKSLWHSLRIIDFGSQIAREGRIYDYGSMNDLYDEVMYCHDWSELFDKYKGIYNGKCTAFRLVAPK